MEDPLHSDLSLLRSMLFASSMVAAKRKTLELYEASYAAERRQEEAATAARQAAAHRREKLLGQAAIATVASSIVGSACLGVVAVVRPDCVAPF